MQAVILAAGRGSRMGELTNDRPKPMLEVSGKTLLQHKFDVLPEEVDEIILIVGYKADVIKNAYGDSYEGRKMTYVTQENIVGGTADALWQAKDLLKGKFLVINGDDIYAGEDFKALLAYDWAILIQRASDTRGGGKVIIGTDNTVIDIIEDSHHSGGEGAINASTFALDTRIFDFPQVAKATGSSEMGLPQTIIAASKTSGIPLNVVEATRWIQITNPDDIQSAGEALSKAV
jgi:UDP-N-acetylglucosamine diphosphorylase / glucose-1-phosphate thymidylyltransferase / UDP-N-acetylgalactosamine diphosphorylase / glucosamine-1-phosphate N-acetyltransferase / galactosamine-1-phosphate N-acetyltransferase